MFDYSERITGISSNAKLQIMTGVIMEQVIEQVKEKNRQIYLLNLQDLTDR